MTSRRPLDTLRQVIPAALTDQGGTPVFFRKQKPAVNDNRTRSFRPPRSLEPTPRSRAIFPAMVKSGSREHCAVPFAPAAASWRRKAWSKATSRRTTSSSMARSRGRSAPSTFTCRPAPRSRATSPATPSPLKQARGFRAQYGRIHRPNSPRAQPALSYGEGTRPVLRVALEFPPRRRLPAAQGGSPAGVQRALEQPAVN